MAETYVAIFEEAFRDKGAVHAYLASSLDFPDWYGNNLEFDKLALALMIAARENPSIDIEIFFATSEQSSR